MVEDSRLVHVTHQVFGCRHCDHPLTTPLRATPSGLGGKGIVYEVPPSCFAHRPDKRSRPGAVIAIPPFDLLRRTWHPAPLRRVGCCGPGYRWGEPNLVCPKCGEDVGYALMDGDHVPWAVYLWDHVVDRPQLPGFPDALVTQRARSVAWEPLHPVPMVTGLPDLYSDDINPKSMPEVNWGFSLDGLTINGEAYRPRWPIAEVRRWVGLGQFPSGTAGDPFWLYCTVDSVREEWWFWVSGGTLHAIAEREEGGVGYRFVGRGPRKPLVEQLQERR